MITRNDINVDITYENTIFGISIEWENEFSVDESELDPTFNYVLVRNNMRYPRNELDGIELYRGVNNSYLDNDIKNGETYYYSLYFSFSNAQNENEYLKTSDCDFSIIAILEGDTAKTIYNHFPRLYRKYDDEINKDDEILNKPLYRICRVFGYELDKIKTYVDKLYDVIDIDKCPDIMLPNLMKFLGVYYDWKLSSKENRILAKIKVSAYSKRGTISGLRIVLTNLLKSKIEISVPKNVVRKDSTPEEIKAKRTITIYAYNFQSDFVWVEDNYLKFMDVINEFVPKKLNVRLVLTNSFFDEYLRSRMSDFFDSHTSYYSFYDSYSRVMDDGFIRSSFVSEVVDTTYSKQFDDVVANRFTDGSRTVDVYSINVTEQHSNRIDQ